MDSAQRERVVRAMRAALRETVARCHNPTHPQYHLYGGRGIYVCSRWRESFDNFLEDMGLRPDGLTLDRKDNNLSYSLENCRWATRAEQSNNTRRTKLITWRGETRSVSEWERHLGWAQGTLKARLGPLGYDVETAFTKPVKCGGKVPGRAYQARKAPDPSLCPRGMSSPLTRLTPAVVKTCRARWAEGETFSALGKEHGVSVTTMSNACQALGAYKDF